MDLFEATELLLCTGTYYIRVDNGEDVCKVNVNREEGYA